MNPIHPEILRTGIASEVPAYVYDLDALRARCRRLLALPIARRRVFFATMANDHPEILRCIRDCGVGAFVNSPAHLRLVLDAGFAPADVVYAASNMTAREMGHCLDLGVNLVLDSIGQIDLLSSVARGVDIGLRLNVGSALDKRRLRHDPVYRFGILPAECARAVDAAARANNRIVGAHSYIGTDLLDVSLLADGLQHLAETARELPDLRYIDAGGGFGVPDVPDVAELDLEDYGRRAAATVRALESQLGRSIELYIEPGRWLVSTSGWFFVKVVDRKLRDDRVFIGTNGSVAGFPRPLLYPDVARHPCAVAGVCAGEIHPLPVWVCGNSTYSQDFLARGIALPLPSVGDTLVFYNAGAYGRSMITSFLGKERPAEFVLDSACFEAADEEPAAAARG